MYYSTKKNLMISTTITILFVILYILLNKYIPTTINAYNNFIANTNNGDTFKDILTVFLTVLSILVGIMATISTLFIGLVDKPSIKIIIKFKQGKLLLSSIKMCILGGSFSVILTACLYVISSKLTSVISNTLILIFIFFFSCFLLSSYRLIKLMASTFKTIFDNDSSAIVDLKSKIKDN